MALLLAGLPVTTPGSIINRRRGSGMDAILTAARAIKAGEANLFIAGGLGSMSRAPFVMPKAETAFSRDNAVYDTTIGWRFVNPLMKAQYCVDSMPETAEIVAQEFQVGAPIRMPSRCAASRSRLQRTPAAGSRRKLSPPSSRSARAIRNVWRRTNIRAPAPRSETSRSSRRPSAKAARPRRARMEPRQLRGTHERRHSRRAP
jgi:acetyl-CoA acetyltransferase